MLVRAGSLMSRGTGAAGGNVPFHPTQLPGLVALYDISDLSTLFVERTGASASTPASVDGVVGTMLDLSGNGNHLVAPSDAGRPVLRQSGDLYYLEFDGVDDGLFTATFAGDVADNHLFQAIDFLDDTGGMLASATGGGNFFIGAFADGNNSTTVNHQSGSPTIFKNGAAFGGTNRTQLSAFLVTGSPSVVECAGYSRENWGAGFHFADYGDDGTFKIRGRLYAMANFSQVVTGQSLSNMRQWMAGKAGVTL